MDHPTVKGAKRWRPGVILKRKSDYEYSTVVRASHGYDIYDIENCTTVSRTRADIKKYKHMKIECKLLEKAHEHLGAMRREFQKNNDFQNPDLDPQVEFDLSDYDKAVKEPRYLRMTQEPFVETPTVSEPSETPEIKQEPIEEETIIEPPIAKTAPKPATRISKEARNLEYTLDGPKWECTENHGRRLRYRTNLLEEEEGTWESGDNIKQLGDPETQET